MMTEDISGAVQDCDIIKENILQDNKHEGVHKSSKAYIYSLKDKIAHKNKFTCNKLNNIYRRETL